MPGEELDLEGQTEDTSQPELPRLLDQRGDDPMPDAQAAALGGDGDRADLGEVLPEHVERAAADDLPARSATQNSWMSSYRVTVAFSSSRGPAPA